MTKLLNKRGRAVDLEAVPYQNRKRIPDAAQRRGAVLSRPQGKKKPPLSARPEQRRQKGKLG